MSRLVWMAVGIGAGVFAVAKARQFAARATPQAIGQRVAGSAVSLSDRAVGFLGRVRAGMAEREAELRAELGMDPS